MLDRVFVCPKCRSTCLAEDWNERKGKCKYCSGNKYNARKVEVDGYLFDSQHEASMWFVLRAQEHEGSIRKLERQVTYRLEVSGLLICKYIADFRYVLVATGEVVVCDAKGVRTPAYKLKKKLMKAIYTIDIMEV
jgi:hypothetical protein